MSIDQTTNIEKNAGMLIGKNICKSYGTKEVLKGLDITIEAGRIYGLIGRNGVGKTTLLGILTGQKLMDSGEVSYDAMPVWDNRDALSHICFSRELGVITTQAAQNSLKVKEYLMTASFYFPNWDQAYADKLMDKFNLDKNNVL